MKRVNKKKIANLTGLVLFVITIGLLSGCGRVARPKGHIADAIRVVDDISSKAAELEVVNNPYPTLSVPTQVQKVGDTYFIVDCYNNQVIYNDNMTDPLYDWKVLTSDIDKGHTIASDGVVYLVDDTENNRVLVFEKSDDKFVMTQVLDSIGIRPHYIVYNDENKTFYAWSSMTGEMYLICRQESDNTVYLADILKIDSLDGVYVRSFTIEGDEVLLVSGNCCIVRASLKDLAIKEIYQVPESMAGMVQITKVDDQYLITISTDVNGDQSFATIIQTPDLKELINDNYKDVYENFIGGGTPYYITNIDGIYYMTEHRLPGHSVWSFEFDAGEIKEVKAIY